MYTHVLSKVLKFTVGDVKCNMPACHKDSMQQKLQSKLTNYTAHANIKLNAHSLKESSTTLSFTLGFIFTQKTGLANRYVLYQYITHPANLRNIYTETS